MVREGLYQTTSNVVVMDVIAAFGLMLFGNLIWVGSAPSVRVAFASEFVMAVILSGSAMMDG
jgi:hypothetical protein